jgi:hypothetical protein
MYTMKVPNDAKIDNSDANKANLNYDAPGACTGKDKTRYLMSWDFSSVGKTAVGDGTLNVRITWAEGTLSAGLYELVGPAFNETTVTYNNYVDGNPITSIQGALLDSDNTRPLPTFTQFTVPQATMQKLLNGTITGLVMGNLAGQYWNHVIAGGEATGIEPYLQFEAIPEPATIGLLGLGGLGILRRRRS